MILLRLFNKIKKKCVLFKVGDVKKALSDETTPEAFKQRYGHEKPQHSTPLIFMCKLGGRAQRGALLAKAELGYEK